MSARGRWLGSSQQLGGEGRVKDDDTNNKKRGAGEDKDGCGVKMEKKDRE